VNEAEPTLATQLQQLRHGLNLSCHAMAELLYTSQQTYRAWEAGAQPRTEARARIETFLKSANEQLQRLADKGVTLNGLVPLNVASSMLGVPHETLFHGYRDAKFAALDIGVMGIWVHEEDLDTILKAILA
jgi:DNA-binding XRE family transcriptional regulator